eukprot:19173-Heterococcus_DN1.PRE.2
MQGAKIICRVLVFERQSVHDGSSCSASNRALVQCCTALRPAISADICCVNSGVQKTQAATTATTC